MIKLHQFHSCWGIPNASSFCMKLETYLRMTKLPSLLRNYIANSVRKSTRAALHRQGIGRHSSEEIYQMGIKDLTALTTLLADNKFMLGDQPSSIDAAVYALLVNLMQVPTLSPINEFAKSQQNFIEYCTQMKSLYYQSA